MGKKQKLKGVEPLIQPDNSKLLTGDVIKEVKHSLAHDRSTAVAGIQAGKTYPESNPHYRSPEELQAEPKKSKK